MYLEDATTLGNRKPPAIIAMQATAKWEMGEYFLGSRDLQTLIDSTFYSAYDLFQMPRLTAVSVCNRSVTC